jgi:Holliday junction resolvase RusA-like endonuclease
MSRIAFTVLGTPAPQGSKTRFRNGGMVESSAKVKPWREAVKYAALDALGEDWQTIAGPVSVTVMFYLRRPLAHYGTGRNAGVLKPNAPAHCITTPDVDKCLRSTLDALTEAGVFRDDKQVVGGHIRKLYETDLYQPGAWISVTEIKETP